jgi:hypothetical protein
MVFYVYSGLGMLKLLHAFNDSVGWLTKYTTNVPSDGVPYFYNATFSLWLDEDLRDVLVTFH